MSFTLRILPRAEHDAQQMFDWIKDRSADGARRWWDAFLDEANRAAEHPERYPRAPENSTTEFDLRQLIFKTRRGRTYRAVFVVIDRDDGGSARRSVARRAAYENYASFPR